jgi:hypothetical protein
MKIHLPAQAPFFERRAPYKVAFRLCPQIVRAKSWYGGRERLSHICLIHFTSLSAYHPISHSAYCFIKAFESESVKNPAES